MIEGIERIAGQLTDKKVRDDVLAKTSGLCLYCGVPLDDSFHIDHFFPKSLGGCDSYENLFPACGYCNNSKGNRPLEDFRHQLEKRKFRESVDMPEFSTRQKEYLKRQGFELYPEKFEPVTFWFERNGIKLDGCFNDSIN